MITSSGLMDAINELEQEFPVGEWRTEDLLLWPMLRVRWFFSIWAAAYRRQEAGAEPGGLGGYLGRAAGVVSGRIAKRAATVKDRRGEDGGRGPRDIIFFSDGVSFVSVNGAQHERFCDPMILRAAELGLSTLLMCPTHAYRIPRFTPSQFVQDSIDIANIRGSLAARQMTSRLSLPRYHEVRRWLNERGYDDGGLDRGSVARDSARLLALAGMFGETLDRVRPKIAFIVSYYYLEGYAFVLACRQRGIPVVDLQHGVQGSLHPAYGRMSTPPFEGFGVVPDVFWVWSGEEAAAIETWAGRRGPHRAYVGGNPWMEMWRTDSVPLVVSARQQARALRAGAGRVPVVLVTLQSGLSELEQLSPLRDLIVASGGEWSWWVRLHPAMADSPEVIHRLLMVPGVSVAVEEPSTLPLYALLPLADIHMTHSSSTVIEAATCGLPSVITSRYGAELFASQITDGIAVLADGDVADRLAAIRRQKRAPPKGRESVARFPRSFDALLEMSGALMVSSL